MLKRRLMNRPMASQRFLRAKTMGFFSSLLVLDQRVALATSQLEARVKVEYNTEALIASGIEARSRPQVHLEAEVHGTIQALDADTVIRINGQPSAEADLKPGMELEARYRTDTGAALRINTTAKVETQADTRGTVKSVNVIAGQLVVETADGKSVVVFLDNTTRITKSGLTLALLGITADAEVKIQLKTGVSRNMSETVEVLGMPGASLDVGASGQAAASGGPGTKGEASAGIVVEVTVP